MAVLADGNLPDRYREAQSHCLQTVLHYRLYPRAVMFSLLRRVGVGDKAKARSVALQLLQLLLAPCRSEGGDRLRQSDIVGVHTEDIGRSLDNDKPACASGLSDSLFESEYGIALLENRCVGRVEIFSFIRIVTEVAGCI